VSNVIIVDQVRGNLYRLRLLVEIHKYIQTYSDDELETLSMAIQEETDSRRSHE
jgi:hypothetical protein